jgi:hypothetical protein
MTSSLQPDVSLCYQRSAGDMSEAVWASFLNVRMLPALPARFERGPATSDAATGFAIAHR